MYAGLEWPERYFGGAFCAGRKPHPVADGNGAQSRKPSDKILFDDATFSFHSSVEELSGLQHKRIGDVWIAVWGIPIPRHERQVFDEFAKVACGDYSGLRSLAGSWAAIVYSSSARKLWLISDCIGTRPILYCQNSADLRLTFASDVCHLRDIGNLGRAINPDVLASWLWFGYNIASTALLTDAKHMAPGAVLAVDSSGRCEEVSYVTIDDATTVDSREELVGCFQRVIGRACAYALETTPCVNVLLSGGWDSRYVLAHLLDRGGNSNSLRLTTVDHFGEAATARLVAEAAGLDVRVVPGTAWPDDSFDQPFNRTFEGLSFTKHSSSLAARQHVTIPAVQGYLGDSLVRAKNARRFDAKLSDSMTPRQQAVVIADSLRSLPEGIVSDDVAGEIRRRSIELTETLLTSPVAGKPAQTFDIYGRQRRYIVNNFLQHIETNEVYLPFLSWELISHYLYARNDFLDEELYPELFRRFYPHIGEVRRHKNKIDIDHHVSRKATEWSRLSARTLMSPNTSGFLRKWWLAPRIALAPFRDKQFYAIRAVAAIGTQLEIIARITEHDRLNLRSVFQG